MAIPRSAFAASLPEHEPLRLLLVSDEVNPHGLSAAELTQPDDLAAALGDPASGINVESLLHVASAELAEATAALDAAEVDVLVYFAHQSGAGQAEFTAAVEGHLVRGGGVVVFHHGMYTAGGKDAILQLLGVTCSGVLWTPNAASPDPGQAVVNVAGEHFVTTQALPLQASTAIEGSALGIAAGTYPSFTNVPDEIYPSTRLLTTPGEERELLFVGVSTAASSGGERVLAYDLRRPEWAGHVIAYQPGEYQPQALDLDGVNFQVLANAIYYTATTRDEPTTSTDETGDESATGTASTTGSTDTTSGSPTSGADDEAEGDDADSTTDAATSSDSSSSSTGDASVTPGESAGADDGEAADASDDSQDSSADVSGSSESAPETVAVEGEAAAGCSCSTQPRSPLAPMSLLLGTLGLVGLRRRRISL